jgi:hypothetical protein
MHVINTGFLEVYKFKIFLEILKYIG